MKKISLLYLFLFAIIIPIFSQEASTQVKWRFAVKMLSASEGQITVTARVQPGWHIYSTKKIEGGPVPTTFDFNESKGVKFLNEFTPSTPAVEKNDPAFGVKIGMWSGNVSFIRRFKLTGNIKDAVVKGSVKYMVCDDKNCMPPTTQSFVSGSKPFVPSK